MSADMAQELKSQGVACVTLYPGPVLTEEIKSATSRQVMSDLNNYDMTTPKDFHEGTLVVSLKH